MLLPRTRRTYESSRPERARHVHGLRVLVGLHGLAGGDLADERQPDDVVLDRHPERREPTAGVGGRRDHRLPGRRQAQRAGRAAAAFQLAGALEGDQVVMDGRRRRQADRVRDLADRRRVAPLGDGAVDELDDAPAALRVVPGHRAA